MKKILFFVAVIATSFAMKAQENAIKANPFALLGGTDLVSYERAVSDNSSVIVGAGIGGFKIAGTKYSSFGASLQYRYYFKEALKGWYAGAFAQYLSGNVDFESFTFNEDTFTTEETTEEISYGAFGGGAKVGHQWIWDSGFTLDLNAGIGYSSFSYDDDSDTTLGLKASGILPNFGLALGYAW